jgi:Skp family chaperone for outer membrane proteins
MLGATVAAAQPVPAKPASAPATGRAPAAAVLFLDRASLLVQSSAGKDMQKQIQALAVKARTELAPEDQKLQADVVALQKIVATLPEATRTQKIKEIEARRLVIQKKAQDRQLAIQAGVEKARGALEKALSPILEAVMRERGANLLLDRGLIVSGNSSLDVTPLVIQRLNAALPKLTVTPVAPNATVAKPAAGKPNG